MESFSSFITPPQVKSAVKLACPSFLLRAEYEVIPFDELRRPLLNAQKNWACLDKFSLMVRLLYGASGSGKTRQVLQLSKELEAIGWVGGFLSEKFQQSDIPSFIHELEHLEQPCYLVVDHAFISVGLLAELLTALSTLKQHTIRVFILSRQKSEWWTQLCRANSYLNNLLLSLATAEDDFNLMYKADQQAEAYDYAIQVYNDLLGIEPLPRYNCLAKSVEYNMPLFIQMAAFRAVKRLDAVNPQQLPNLLAHYEQRLIVSTLLEPEQTQARMILLMSTLLGRVLNRDEIIVIWSRIGFANIDTLPNAINRLESYYMTPEGVSALMPSLLGRGLLSLLLKSHKDLVLQLITDCLQQGSTLEKYNCFSQLAELLKYDKEQAMTIAQCLKPLFIDYVDEYLELCMSNPSEGYALVFIYIFKSLDKLEQEQLATKISPFINNDQPALAEIGSILYTHNIRNLPQELATIDSQLAYVVNLTHLSHALYTIGKLDEAKNAIEKAYDFYESNKTVLDIKLSERIRVAVARLLMRCFMLLIGQNAFNYTLAKAIGEQCLALARTLYQGNPLEYIDIYRAILLYYTSLLIDSTEEGQALALSLESVVLAEQNYDKDPVIFAEDYAITLNNHVTLLNNLCEFSVCEPFAFKAVNIYKNILKNSNNYTFIKGYIMSLNNYIKILGEVAKYQDCLFYAEQALQLTKPYYEQFPHHFMEAYTRVLNNYGYALNTQGKQEQAMLAYKEALELAEQLYKEEPALYTKLYAICSSNYGSSLEDLGQTEEANVYYKQYGRLMSQV